MVPCQTDVLLSIERVSKSFPGVRALDNVSLRVKRGTVHAIVGENGAGKSTLMKILSGVYSMDEGSVVFDGVPLENPKPIEVLRSGMSIVYQEFNLINDLNIGENIYLGRYNEMKGLRNIHREAKTLLESCGSKESTYALAGDLSNAEKQKVEIAKALSFHSKLIIMDEPSSSLTHRESEHLINLIAQLKKKGVTILYISHRLEEIFRFCDNVTVMRDGCVIDTKPVSEVSRADLIEKMVGRSMKNEFPERPRCASSTLMEIKGLSTHKLKNISFELKRGEILGLLGLVGSGRTEIVRALFGVDKRLAGEIYIEGKKKEINSPKDAIKAGIGFVTEDRKEQGLILPFSVEQNISMASIDKLIRKWFISSAKERDMAERHIQSLSIKTPTLKAKTLNLSGGNQQKCIVARWLEISPKILLMDEPTRGIDVATKYEIYLIMKQIVEEGSSIILITSDLSEVINMSNRVITIRDGYVTGIFNPEESTATEMMDSAIG
jgi:ribose transport system ATP-binding protein